LWSRWFFGEPFNRNKVVGLSLVVLGVFFIGFGNS
jgi:multidrug transporter EmrE-like cation transporter